MMESLRCLSFNLWKNEGRFEERLDRLVKLLPGIGADIIALQECFTAEELGIDVAASIADACGLHLSRAKLREKIRIHNGRPVVSRSDMAVLSREEAISSELIQLPADPRDGERALLKVSVQLRNGLLHVGCTHLTHLRDEAAVTVRKAQAEAIAAILLDGRPSSALLLGDLNARAGASELDALLAHPRLHPASAALAIKAPCGVAPGDGSLDHILVLPAMGETIEVGREILFSPDSADPDSGPSDHPAILTDMVWP